MASPPEPPGSRQPDEGGPEAAAGGEVRKCGYLRKLKHGHRRFFVLRAGEGAGGEAGARLEYYESEKKWRGQAGAGGAGAAPRRAVALGGCLAVHKRADAKARPLLALYGREESWALAAESLAERDAWFEALSRLLRPPPAEVWQVRLKARGLGGRRRGLSGVHRLCLGARWLALVRPAGERPALTLPLAAVRRCGHAESCFFLELGRSAAPGPGELWMQAEHALAARHIHESVLRAMRALRRPEPQPDAAAPRQRLNRARTASEGDAVPAPAAHRRRTRSLNAPADSRRGPDYVPMSPAPEDGGYVPMGGAWRAKGSPHDVDEEPYVPMAPRRYGCVRQEETRHPDGPRSRSPDGKPFAAAARRQAKGGPQEPDYVCLDSPPAPYVNLAFPGRRAGAVSAEGTPLLPPGSRPEEAEDSAESPSGAGPVAALARLRICEGAAEGRRAAAAGEPRGRRRHRSETAAAASSSLAAGSPFAPGPRRPNSASEENVSLLRQSQARGGPMCRETSAGFQHGLDCLAGDGEPASAGGRGGARRPLRTGGGIREAACASRECLAHKVKEAAAVKVC